MKRYMLFAGSRYYAAGGAADFVMSTSFLSLAERAALAFLNGEAPGYLNGEELEYVWAHIFDAQENLIIKEWGTRT